MSWLSLCGSAATIICEASPIRSLGVMLCELSKLYWHSSRDGSQLCNRHNLSLNFNLSLNLNLNLNLSLNLVPLHRDLLRRQDPFWSS